MNREPTVVHILNPQRDETWCGQPADTPITLTYDEHLRALGHGSDMRLCEDCDARIREHLGLPPIVE